MSETDLALDASASLELLLEKRFGAEGRGLHEKVSSVETQLHDDVIRKLRYIASVRNSVVHRRDKIQDPERFARLTEESLLALSEGFYSTPKDVLSAYSEGNSKTTPSHAKLTVTSTPKIEESKEARPPEKAEKNTDDDIELSNLELFNFLLPALLVTCLVVFSFAKFGFHTFHDQHGGSLTGAILVGALGLGVAWKFLSYLIAIFYPLFQLYSLVSISLYAFDFIFDSKLSNLALSSFKSFVKPFILYLVNF